jgi:hypothetical protein
MLMDWVPIHQGPHYPGPSSRRMLPLQANFPSEGESSQLQENINQEYNVIVKYIRKLRKTALSNTYFKEEIPNIDWTIQKCWRSGSVQI